MLKQKEEELNTKDEMISERERNFKIQKQLYDESRILAENVEIEDKPARSSWLLISILIFAFIAAAIFIFRNSSYLYDFISNYIF